jgi:hypothetical protein
MATNENTIILRENIYSGGTLAAAEGAELTPEQAYALGVTADGAFDRTLSTDELRERSGAAPVAAVAAPAAPGDTDLSDATAAEVVSYLQDHPDAVDRIAAMEQDRESPRKTVLDAVERLRGE